ncbi:MAG TPA: hypothetical protein VK203_13390 [Nostocaceae cyanobacterium]|nr:hypothetical protein [Nostocaceae cyanobacterium]
MTQALELSTIFQENKYVILKSFLEDPLLSVAYNYILMMDKIGKTDKGGLQVPGSARLRYDAFIETLLEELRPKVELAAGKKLHSSYAYVRIYKHGDVLTKHKDRAACEVAITVTLGCDGSTNWPIYLNGPKGVSEITLELGDALLYRGIEVEHWREKFSGEHQIQLMMFYVEQDGLYAEWKFDQRKQLGVVKPVTLKSKINYLVKKVKLQLDQLLGIS